MSNQDASASPTGLSQVEPQSSQGLDGSATSIPSAGPFLLFQDRHGEAIAVNPAHVTMVRGHLLGSQPTSFIYMKGEGCEVQGYFRDVVDALASQFKESE